MRRSGKGSAFFIAAFRIDACSPATGTKGAFVSRVNNAACHRSVLIVDDEQTVCTTLSLLLKRMGFTPVTAISGTDALAKFNEQSFDLVITDFSMPEMSGLELAVAMKGKNPRQPIIMLTAFVEKFRFQPPLPGIDKLMGKPISVGDLKDAVEAVMQERNPEAALN